MEPTLKNAKIGGARVRTYIGNRSAKANQKILGFLLEELRSELKLRAQRVFLFSPWMQPRNLKLILDRT